MNTMTGIAREAMRRAQAGDWALADAIELLARETDSGMSAASEAASEDVQLLCGIPEGGRLRYLIWVDGFDGLECEHCHVWPDGDGEAISSGKPCTECMDQGITNNPFNRGAVWDRLATVTNLNGDLVWSATGEVDLPDGLLSHDTQQMPAAAMRLVAEYQDSLGKVEQPHIHIPEAA